MEANTHSPFLRALETGGPWVADLLRALDSSLRSALAESSKAGLKTLLEEWPETATLEILIKGSDAEVPAPRTKALRSARAQLQARGSLPTQLALAQDDSREMSQDDAWWDRVLPELTWEGVRSLALTFQHIPAVLLSCAGQAFQHLTTLRIEPTWYIRSVGTAQLPPPTALPALRHLTIDWRADDSQATLYQSIAPYMQQLSSFCILDDYDIKMGNTEPVWSLAFSRTNPSPTLTHLDIPTYLTMYLIRLLKQAAPQLQQLVCKAPIRSADFADGDASNVAAGARVCSWTRWGVLGGTESAERLMLTPLPAEGKLSIELRNREPPYGPRSDGSLDITLPVSDAVTQKLPRTEFSGIQKLCVRSFFVRPDQQAAALSHALTPVAQALHPCDLEVYNFTMSPALASEIAAAHAAGWHNLSLTSLKWPADAILTTSLPPLCALTFSEQTQFSDSLISQLVQHASTIEGMCVCGGMLALQSPLADGAQLPVRRITVRGRVDIREWVGQATLLGAGVKWELNEVDLCLTEEQVESGDAARLVEQLKCIKVTYVRGIRMPKPEWCSQADEPCVLQAHLAIVRQLPDRTDLQTWTGDSIPGLFGW